MKRAFTLAEVLITLVIIGVIASMTVPTLLQNINNRHIIAALQETQSIFSQAFKQAMINTTCSNLSCTGIFDYAANSAGFPTDVTNKFVEYSGFKIAQRYTSTGWMRYRPLVCEKISCSTNAGSATNGFFVANNGIAYRLDSFSTILSQNCSNTYNICGILQIFPNAKDAVANRIVYGRNNFTFLVLNDGTVTPAVVASDASFQPYKNRSHLDLTQNLYCNPNYGSYSNVAGASCAARIFKENWEVNY